MQEATRESSGKLNKTQEAISGSLHEPDELGKTAVRPQSVFKEEQEAASAPQDEGLLSDSDEDGMVAYLEDWLGDKLLHHAVEVGYSPAKQK